VHSLHPHAGYGRFQGLVVPDDHLTVHTGGRQLADVLFAPSVDGDLGDGVLVDGAPGGVLVSGGLLVQLLELGHGTEIPSFFLLHHAQFANKGNLLRVVNIEQDQLAVMTSDDDAVWARPLAGQEGQIGGPQHASVEVFGGIDHADGAVVAHPSKTVTRAVKGHAVHPTTRTSSTQLLHATAKWHLLPPRVGLRLVLNLLDVRREDSGFEISRAGRQQVVIGMPVQAGHSGTNGFLDVLAYPPVILLLKVADRNQTSSAAHCELVLLWRPLDTGGSSVDAQDDEGWFPSFAAVQRPHVGIAVRATSHNSVAGWGPVDARHTLGMLTQGEELFVVASLLGIDVHLMTVGGDGNLATVLVPCMAGDWSEFKVELLVV